MMLNCDLGESFGAWHMPVDEQIMVHIDMANIACGFHAGDPLVLELASQLWGLPLSETDGELEGLVREAGLLAERLDLSHDG